MFGFIDEERILKWNSFQQKTLSETEIGKYVLCEAKEDETTRLYIHRFASWMLAVTKDGWWDTFTISKKPCFKGFYLCEIMEFRLDKNGYLNMIVNPSKFLGEAINEDRAGWEYLQWSGKFTSEYKERQHRSRFNVDNLYKKFRSRCDESGYTDMAGFIFNLFMTGQVSIDDISEALEEKYEIEQLAEQVNRNLKQYAERYPLLVKKLPTDNRYGRAWYTTQETMQFLQSKSEEYARLKLGDSKDILDQVETVLVYWDEIHQAQKNAKKAAKRAKKAIA